EPPLRARDLEDAEPTAGPQDAAQLLERRLEVIDVAHAEADDCGVEARIREREREHVSLHPLELRCLAAGTLEHPLGEVEADDVPRAGLACGGGGAAPAPA